MLSRLFTQPTEERAQATVWGNWPGDNTSSSPVVTPTSAMQLLAVSGCVRLITDSISTLPVDVYRERADGVREEISKPRWLKNPTVDLDFTSWASQVLTSLLLHGNAYCAVTRSGTQIVEVVPVDPSTVHVARVAGRKVYLVGNREFTGELVHIPAAMLPGTDVGMSPLEYARQSISLGLSAQTFGADQFDQSLNMPGVIEVPGAMQPGKMSEMAQAWRKARTRRGRGLPGVLEGGATWKPTGVTNEQAQFLQTRQWTAAEIAAQVYMVDPSDLGIPVNGSSLTYANLEQRNLRRLQVTFLPWIIRIEKALSTLLPNPQYVKFNVDGLLRADSSARWTNYRIASEINAQAAAYGQPPVLLTQEMRDFEDLNVIEEYPDATLPVPPAEPMVQQNSSTPDINVTVNGAEAPTFPTIEPRIETHVHMPDAMAEPNAAIAEAVNRTTESVERLETSVSDTLARIADLAEQFDDAVRSIPQPVVNLPEPVTTVRRVERDEHGRILRVIDEVA